MVTLPEEQAQGALCLVVRRGTTHCPLHEVMSGKNAEAWNFEVSFTDKHDRAKLRDLDKKSYAVVL